MNPNVDVGYIVQQIRREKIPAIFVERISDPLLLESGIEWIDEEFGADNIYAWVKEQT